MQPDSDESPSGSPLKTISATPKTQTRLCAAVRSERDGIRRNQRKPFHPYRFCFSENACVLLSAHAFSVLITAPTVPHTAPKKAAYEPA